MTTIVGAALPADFLYGRLLATAAQHALGGAARAGLSHADTLSVGGRWISVLRRP
jgi:hypothetical protein